MDRGEGPLLLDHLLKLRVVVARVGEMDLAQWWNTRGQLGRLGAAAVIRGLPRTHWFAQARAVFSVAGQRCDEIFNPPGSTTLWRLPAELEERFEARWGHWLGGASEWEEFFSAVAETTTSDLRSVLVGHALVVDSELQAVVRLAASAAGRSVELTGPFDGSREQLNRLALAFSLGSPGNLVVPYVRLAQA